jgi:transposase InsO family protein
VGDPYRAGTRSRLPVRRIDRQPRPWTVTGHRTLAEGWAFKKFHNSESARLAALPAWIHEYNHHRPHSAIGKRSPITRLDNLAGHHT